MRILIGQLLSVFFLCMLTACNDTQALPKVALETAYGDIIVEVNTQAAPVSAADFLLYVERGWFDGAGFYRVVRPDNDNGSPIISVIQGGLLEDAEAHAPIAHEPTSQTGLKHLDGTLSLARGDVGTGSASAFFICIGAQPSLDEGGMRNRDGAGFAAFGQVIEGMDVVRAILALKADAKTDDAYVAGQILADPVLFKARLLP
jgi:peptidyl-prolyl cis-trans isomerase A (cyclophilin A)